MKKARERREVMGGQDVLLCFTNTIIFPYFPEDVNYRFPPKMFSSGSCIDSVSSGFLASMFMFCFLSCWWLSSNVQLPMAVGAYLRMGLWSSLMCGCYCQLTGWQAGLLTAGFSSVCNQRSLVPLVSPRKNSPVSCQG